MVLRLPTQTSELRDYVVDSNQFYFDLLGYQPENTSLQIIPEKEWDEFVTQIGLDPSSSGFYLPRNQTAAIRNERPLTLFHEYFGHGLFCEQTLKGRMLIDLEGKLLEEERATFAEKSFTLEDLNKFRSQNKVFYELEKFRKQNLVEYELFAIWTEYLLSNMYSLREQFDERYDSLTVEEKKTIDPVINFSKVYGNLATFYAFGLRKVQDKKRLLKLSQDIFGRMAHRARLILHFGSGKPFSDIDLFVISSEIPSTYDPWLDVRSYNEKNIEEGIHVLDPMITDPIMVGRPISGENRYLCKLKEEAISQPITEDSIRFSLGEYEKELKRARDSSMDESLRIKNLRSARTFLTNALALKRGHKILTFRGLVEYSHNLSQNGSFIELKGGIE